MTYKGCRAGESCGASPPSWLFVGEMKPNILVLYQSLNIGAAVLGDYWLRFTWRLSLILARSVSDSPRIGLKYPCTRLS
jgi:hypothetical protein